MRLTERNAFICAGTADDAAEARFLDAYRDAVGGQPPARGMREAKKSLRSAPEPKSGPPSGVPLWAAYLLRGAW